MLPGPRNPDQLQSPTAKISQTTVLERTGKYSDGCCIQGLSGAYVHECSYLQEGDLDQALLLQICIERVLDPSDSLDDSDPQDLLLLNESPEIETTEDGKTDSENAVDTAIVLDDSLNESTESTEIETTKDSKAASKSAPGGTTFLDDSFSSQSDRSSDLLDGSGFRSKSDTSDESFQRKKTVSSEGTERVVLSRGKCCDKFIWLFKLRSKWMNQKLELFFPSVRLMRFVFSDVPGVDNSDQSDGGPPGKSSTAVPFIQIVKQVVSPELSCFTFRLSTTIVTEYRILAL